MLLQTAPPPVDTSIPSTIQGVVISILVLGTPHIIAGFKALSGILKARADSAAAQVVTLEILNQRLAAYEAERKEYRADQERRLTEVETRADAAQDRADAAEKRADEAEQKATALQTAVEESEAKHASRYGDYEKTIGTLRNDLSNMIRAYDERGVELDATQTTLRVVTEERDLLRIENTEQRRQIGEMRAEIDTLRERVDELESTVHQTPSPDESRPSSLGDEDSLP